MPYTCRKIVSIGLACGAHPASLVSLSISLSLSKIAISPSLIATSPNLTLQILWPPNDHRKFDAPVRF